MGSGKSLALKYLSRLRGVAVLSADEIGHRLLGKREIAEKLRKAFGGTVLLEGRVDRARLAAVAFRNRAGVAKLNRLLHPAIRRELVRRIGRFRRSGAHLIVVEMPLLFEGRFEGLFDGILSISAPDALRQKRIGRERFFQRQRFQWSQRRKDMGADWVLRNVSSRPALKRTLSEWAHERMKTVP